MKRLRLIAAATAVFALGAGLSNASANACRTCWNQYHGCMNSIGDIYFCSEQRDDCLYNNGCPVP